MPTWEARYALAVLNPEGAFLGFVPGARLDPVQLPAEARKYVLPADARIDASGLSIALRPNRVVAWDLVMQAPLDRSGGD